MPVLLGNSKASRQRMAKLQALSAAPSASPITSFEEKPWVSP